MKEHIKDIVAQVTGFLSAMLMFFTAVGLKFDWFNAESINAFGFLTGAAITLIITLVTIYQNRYGFTKKARAAKKLLERNNLK